MRGMCGLSLRQTVQQQRRVRLCAVCACVRACVACAASAANSAAAAPHRHAAWCDGAQWGRCRAQQHHQVGV